MASSSWVPISQFRPGYNKDRYEQFVELFGWTHAQSGTWIGCHPCAQYRPDYKKLFKGERAPCSKKALSRRETRYESDEEKTDFLNKRLDEDYEDYSYFDNIILDHVHMFQKRVDGRTYRMLTVQPYSGLDEAIEYFDNLCEHFGLSNVIFDSEGNWWMDYEYSSSEGAIVLVMIMDPSVKKELYPLIQEWGEIKHEYN